MLSSFTKAARAIAATRSKKQKEEILGELFRALDDASLERAAVFFSGSPFPRRDERVTGVGWATIADAVVAATGASHDEIWSATGEEGDLGDAVVRFFPETTERDLSLVELGEAFDALAATSGSLAKTELLTNLFQRLDREGARVTVKILQGEFRIGLQQGLVESALAKAFSRPVDAVRRAHMLTADLGATALLARSGALESASIQLFNPVGLMLAQAEENPERIVSELGQDAVADDKYDGIRAQVHFDGRDARIYSRTLDEITARFPEIAAGARSLRQPSILDGEIVAWRDGILPFAVLQTRIGRRKVTAKLLEEAPVVLFAFDVLYLDGRSLLEEPLRDRLERLRTVLSEDGVIRISEQSPVRDAAHVDELFDEARRRGNEGLVVKDPGSFYTPGRRGKSWLKYKKALATLDCVVTAAEYGHGKRRGVLSDYTFAVRSGEQLLNIGKAYSGLTDVEIDELTAKFKEITTGRYGPVHAVRPEVVLEIAFDRIQESKRHKSGYALRFPRIACIRSDKTVDEISTIDEVRRIYEGQLSREEGARGNVE